MMAKRTKLTHNTPKIENPGGGGRGDTRRRMAMEVDSSTFNHMIDFIEGLQAKRGETPDFRKRVEASKKKS
jgi:hypothetical protein